MQNFNHYVVPMEGEKWSSLPQKNLESMAGTSCCSCTKRPSSTSTRRKATEYGYTGNNSTTRYNYPQCRHWGTTAHYSPTANRRCPDEQTYYGTAHIRIRYELFHGRHRPTSWDTLRQPNDAQVHRQLAGFDPGSTLLHWCLHYTGPPTAGL
jgi:hypothetical protein